MGRDKAALRLPDGHTMHEHVADALRMACAHESIVIVGATQSPGLARGSATPVANAPSDDRANPGQARGYVHVADIRPRAGPLGGIEALLASNLAREYLICPCDVPFITPDVLRLLLAQRDKPAAVFQRPGRDDFDPLPARLHCSALPIVRRLLDNEQRSVWKLMEELPAAIIDIDAHQAAALRNINTPEDLAGFGSPQTKSKI